MSGLNIGGIQIPSLDSLIGDAGTGAAGGSNGPPGSLGSRNAQGTTPFGQFPLARRTIGSRTSFCSVAYFHYDKQNFGTSTNVNKGKFSQKEMFGVTKGVIEEELRSVKVSKNIGQASGTFEIQLHPSQNWKSVLAPGDWIAIYIYDRYHGKDQQPKAGTNSKNLIMLGNIDRIARTLEKDKESDKNKLAYVISGRNFGKAFEEMDIWFDPYATQVNTLDVALRTSGLEIVGNPTTMVKKVLDIFMGPGTKLQNGRTSPLQQWIIPQEVANIFGTKKFVIGKPLVYDILDKHIQQNLPGFKTRQMLTPESNGNAWEMLQRSSNQLVNELFLEEVRDNNGNAKPTLILRPRPLNTPAFLVKGRYSQFGKDDASARPLLRKAYQTLQKLGQTSFLEISQAEVKYENLGRDDHSRLNMFWLSTTQNFEYAFSHMANNNSGEGIANPTFQRASIQRAGLRRMEQNLEFCYAALGDDQTATTASQAPGPAVNLFKAFMTQLYDMNYANHLYESGTLSCTGVLEAELGKALILKADPAVPSSKDKVFYIEGYDHEWTFPNHWTTTFTVTHGQFFTKDGNIFIDSTHAGDFGDEDKTIDNAYLTKTGTRKG